MAESRGYQVCLFMGRQAPTIEGTAVIPLFTEGPSTEEIEEVLRVSGLTPSDLRARTLFMVDSADVVAVLSLYSFLIGFCGRRLDVAVKDEVIDASALHDAASRLPDSGKPEIPHEFMVAGEQSAEFPYVDSGSELTPDDVSAVKYARKVLLARPSDVRSAVVEFLAVSGLRFRNNSDRLPFLATVPGEEVDLDSLRRAGGEMRRSIRTDNRNSVVAPVDLTERQARWLAAASSAMPAVLERLGSVQNEDTELWRCPRPERHTNGDANPSMKVTDNMVRCFRCDAEPVDALRLVMDSRELTPDEAAAWLSSAVPAGS